MNKKKLFLTLGILGSLGAAGMGARHLLHSKNNSSGSNDTDSIVGSGHGDGKINIRFTDFHSVKIEHPAEEKYSLLEGARKQLERLWDVENFNLEDIKNIEDADNIRGIYKRSVVFNALGIPVASLEHGFEGEMNGNKISGLLSFKLRALYPVTKEDFENPPLNNTNHFIVKNKSHGAFYSPHVEIRMKIPEGEHYLEEIKLEDPVAIVNTLGTGIKIANTYLKTLKESNHLINHHYSNEIARYQKEIETASKYFDMLSSNHEIIWRTMRAAEDEYSKKDKLTHSVDFFVHTCNPDKPSNDKVFIYLHHVHLLSELPRIKDAELRVGLHP